MALFAPTFIYPDARNGLGQGTIDATQDLTVSWRVNGANAMTAFQIVIYQNNAASTQLYSTGRITDGCPFYGTNSSGEIEFFSYTIPAATLASSNITNGNNYKLIITQWWSANDSVTQTSASAFITRATPVLTIPTIGTINTRYYTFTANYTQAQGDVLNWLRWRIAVSGQESTPLYDSQEIGGTMELSAYYDGFFTGQNYTVNLTVQTENGIEATTGWVPFSVEYNTPEITGYVFAQCDSETSAVFVEWRGIASILGVADGPYSIEDGIITLPEGSTITWDEVNLEPMSLETPWSILWRGILANSDVTLFTIGQSGGDITLVYTNSTRTLELSKGGTSLASQNGIVGTANVTVILTQTTLYIRSEYIGGGLYPSTTLYPSTRLYPRSDDHDLTSTYELSVSYTPEDILSAQIGGPAQTDYLEVMRGTPSGEVITAAWANGTYVPSSSPNDWMLADFSNGIDASNLDIGGQTITGFSLYRRQQNESALVHMEDVSVGTTSVYDYSAKSQQGPYFYYLFPIGATSYIAEPLTTTAVNPCWWSWSLMECAETTDKKIFNVLAEYRFGKNFSSSAMGNGNNPNVLNNFTPYPTVQLAPQNYKKGTLTGLIGHVDYENGSKYYDTVSLMDKLYALSLSRNSLFLKDRKGRLMKVRLSSEVSMQTMDNTPQQAQTITVSWVECGSVEGISLIAQAPMVQGRRSL